MDEFFTTQINLEVNKLLEYNTVDPDQVSQTRLLLRKLGGININCIMRKIGNMTQISISQYSIWFTPCEITKKFDIFEPSISDSSDFHILSSYCQIKFMCKVT